jgi:mxaJ protein
MFSRFLSFGAVLLFCFVAYGAELKVCADPANLPFSDSNRRGFDNRVAELLARELGAKVTYQWARYGRGFVRNVVTAGACDVMIGLPEGIRGLQIAGPYYRSTYVFVTRTREKQISSFDDPALRHMKIAVQVLEDDYAPPARALSRRGLTNNIIGFELNGDDDGGIIRAVALKQVDAAIVWGPLAGYYARKFGSNLKLMPVLPEVDPPLLAFTFRMGVGVRKDNPELFARVQRALQARQSDIQRILRTYNVPLLEAASPQKLAPSTGGGRR